MQPEELTPPVLDDASLATRARWRTPLALVLAVPVGIAFGEAIWASGMGGLCILVYLGPAPTMAVAWLATRYRTRLVLLTALAAATVLVNHALAFDVEVKSFRDPTRHLLSGGLTVAWMTAWPVLAFRLWRTPPGRAVA